MAERQVWVCIPTAQKDHVPKVLAKWEQKGYRIALWVDPPVIVKPISCAAYVMGPYPGIWNAWNALARLVFSAYNADVVVLAGDDMEPDPNHSADEIACQYLERYPNGEGVMQPCGDLKGDLIDGWRNAGRICGSPWIGRQWAKDAYNGHGPVCGQYGAFYADEELLNYAGNLGMLWRREDLSQQHLHWSWGFLPKQLYHDRNQKLWDADYALFEARRQEPRFKSGRFEKLGWYQAAAPCV